MSRITTLAQEQLAAYNASDLDAFVGCYHPDVRVLHGEEEAIRGREAFRQRYRDLFEKWSFGATVPNRMGYGVHCIDLEDWWRIDPKTDEKQAGRILVRYTERDGLIGIVQFLS